MEMILLHRLTRFTITYHFLSYFVFLLVIDGSGVSGRAEPKTKLLLQNIRTHLAQKLEEVVQQKECESGLTLCKGFPNKAEGDEEKSEEILPPPKIVRGYHKPLLKISPKNVIHTMLPKVQKSLIRRARKEVSEERSRKRREDSEDESEERGTAELNDDRKIKKSKKSDYDVKHKIYKNFKVTSTKTEKPEDVEGGLENEKKGTSTLMNVEKRTQRNRKTEILSEDMEVIVKNRNANDRKRLEDNLKSQTNIFEIPIDSFVFTMNSNEVRTDLCRKHKNIYLNQLKKYKTWALMMYDASAKPPSGILKGNINQLGDFDECLSINAVFKKHISRELPGIRGKYCLANIDVSTTSNNAFYQPLERLKGFSLINSTIYDPGHFIPKFSSVIWGVCVPESCLAEDVEKLINSQLQNFNVTTNFKFEVNISEENCAVNKNKFEFELATLAILIFYATVLSVTILATYRDVKIKKKPSKREKVEMELAEASEDIQETEVIFSSPVENIVPSREKTEDIIMAFSLKRNMKKLLTNENTEGIKCVNGIKSLFTIMLYFAHKTIPLAWTPFSNRTLFSQLSNETSTIFLRASMIYTDGFLLISGLLTSYNLSREITLKGEISWTKKIAARFLRLTPALLAVLLFYAYIWDHLGSGPMWNTLVKKNSDLCRKYMWKNLLYIQNFFAFENMCAPQTHQLALDMQLFIFAPLFVNLLHKYDKVGFGILQALFLLSSIVRYTSAANNHLSIIIYHGMPVSQLYRTADLLYIQTLHRASPYLMGTIVGYYLDKLKTHIQLPRILVGLAWTIALTFGLYSIAFPSNMAQRKYKYDVAEAAQYAALSPVAWSLSMAWVILACHSGLGGKLNEFLCNKWLLRFSRISYSMYLTQFLVFFYKVGIKRAPEVFSLYASLDISEFLTVILISTVLTLLFDIPMMEIKKIILDKKWKGEHENKIRQKVKDDDPQQNVEENFDHEETPNDEVVEEEYLNESDGDLEETWDEDNEYERDYDDDDDYDEEGEEETKLLRRPLKIHFDDYDKYEDQNWLKIEEPQSE